MLKAEGIAGIVLAAGFSSRMGGFKPLLPFGNKTAVERTLLCLRQAGIDDVKVVVGHQAERVIDAVVAMEVKAVFNPRFSEGMFSSVQAGVKALGRGVEAFFLLPVDYPLISYHTIEQILHRYRFVNKGIVYPTFHHRRGHPPLIAASYAAEIGRYTSKLGLRGLLAEHEVDVFEVPVSDEAVLLDMDHPEDYQSLLHYFETQKLPSEAQRLPPI